MVILICLVADADITNYDIFYERFSLHYNITKSTTWNQTQRITNGAIFRTHYVWEMRNSDSGNELVGKK